ncbi:hypothetical protein N7457_003016 [Penicillium paradoxum]|uniref:uncharacterized protein n=1 Tax=Penicillium paradoxum TaxID=176176 RepID=UPI0025495377|nr:uncharacterized protein N7457_003016 [Penicillium paradoxum]KAJ5788026.1 hypothetical protein N7457_003016 [Penicillium paradoxum]
MWRCARNSQDKSTERTSQRGRDERYPPYNQRMSETRYDTTTNPNPTNSSWSWESWRSQSSFSNLSAGSERESRDSDSGHTQTHIELLRKYIEAEPYSALFGRRLDPFNNFGQYDTLWNGFLQSLSRTKKSNNTKSPRADKWQPKSYPNHVGLQYDPISGRTEVEANFASDPSLTENGQVQPGSTGSNPIALLSSQSTSDYPPGSELETIFNATPIISQDAHAKTQNYQANERKPDMGFDCPLGNELDSLLVSESDSSVQTQPDRFKVDETPNGLNLDAGLSVGTSVECSPGSELEAKSISHPASRCVRSPPSRLETQCPNKQLGISVDCPPGNELDAKLSSEATGFIPKTDNPTYKDINKITHTSHQGSFECSPGSENETRIVFESTSQGVPESKAQTPINCPPGGELETNFICNQASAKGKVLQADMSPSVDSSPEANIAVDCALGNELEAKFICDMASAKSSDGREDMGALNADEIRSRYVPSESNTKPPLLESDASEDRVGDSILQRQNPAIENTEQPPISHKRSPKFHILAFDTSTSQVSATEADSFFGIDKDARPNEILFRLHSPAKFIPYFKKMEEDGYEIATGGGNILVFRKAQSDPSHTLPSSTATNQDPSIHPDVVEYLLHDSLDPASVYPGGPNPPTTEPPTPGPFNLEPEVTQNSESTFRKAGRRMLLAGTITAATCYAIGVVTEFFRTGGQDGRGTDGLTAFEADRRHRE